MRRVVQALSIVDAITFMIGIITWPSSLSIPMLVIGTAAVLATLFAWFRFDDLASRSG